MSGCNYCFIIEKGQFIEWTAITGLANQLNTFEKNTLPLKILDHCNGPPEIMMLPLKFMVASAPLETIRNRNIIKYIAYMQFMVASAFLRNTVSISIEK